MSVETIHPYRHSGKFSVIGPVAAIAVGAVASVPLGLAYAYLIKWIPIVYLNVLLTLGYGFVFGFLTVWVLKRTKVRNTTVAVASAFAVGLASLYGNWNGHLHALLDEAPLAATPDVIWGFVGILYEVGSWSMRGGENVTGIPLAIVWAIEAGMILVVAVGFTFHVISRTPFCETQQRWLDRERKLDTLAPFTDAAQLAVLKSGDITPLLDAKPREAGSSLFTRVTLRDAEGCETFCTMQLETVSVSVDKDGKEKEKTEELTTQLVLPHAMRELVEKFATFTPAQPPPPATPAPAAS